MKAALLTALATANAMSIPQLFSPGMDLLGGVAESLFHKDVTQAQDPLVATTTAPEPGMRLLSFGEDELEWHTEVEKWDLKREGRRFIDVTDHIEEYKVAKVMEKVEYPANVQFEKQIKELAQNITKDNMRKNLVQFSSFHTRYYKSDTGLESSLWLRDQIQEIAQGRDDITVSTFDHEWQQKSLIVRIEGVQNPDDVVIVGAHQDSINLLFPSLLAAPGADDDGSGTVTTWEVFRILVQHGFKPRNTLEFHWYSAEEGGLLGSQDVFSAYAKKGTRVKAMLQQDMTGYSKGSKDATGSDALGVITDYVDEGLTDFIKLVVDSYCDIPYVETLCGYACSDHASSRKHGYPSAFVIESEFKNSDPFIHSTMDTVDRLSFDHMKEHAKLTLGYAYELSQHDF